MRNKEETESKFNWKGLCWLSVFFSALFFIEAETYLAEFTAEQKFVASFIGATGFDFIDSFLRPYDTFIGGYSSDVIGVTEWLKEGHWPYNVNLYIANAIYAFYLLACQLDARMTMFIATVPFVLIPLIPLAFEAWCKYKIQMYNFDSNTGISFCTRIGAIKTLRFVKFASILMLMIPCRYLWMWWFVAGFLVLYALQSGLDTVKDQT